MASNEQIFFIERDTFMGLLENAIAAEQVSVIEPLVKRMCDIVGNPIQIYNFPSILLFQTVDYR